MKTKYWIAIILALVLAMAVITKPSTSRHHQKISLIVQNILQEQLATATTEDSTGDMQGMVSSMMGGALIQQAISQIVEVDDYLVCSVAKMQYDGQSIPLSVGLLGTVYLDQAVEDKIREELESRGHTLMREAITVMPLSEKLKLEDSPLTTSPETKAPEKKNKVAQPITEDAAVAEEPPAPAEPKPKATLETRKKSSSAKERVATEKVYFHSKPNPMARSNSYIISGDKVLKLSEKNGYAYCVYTNKNGGETHGWLRMKKLNPQ